MPDLVRGALAAGAGLLLAVLVLVVRATIRLGHQIDAARHQPPFKE